MKQATRAKSKINKSEQALSKWSVNFFNPHPPDDALTCGARTAIQ